MFTMNHIYFTNLRGCVGFFLPVVYPSRNSRPLSRRVQSRRHPCLNIRHRSEAASAAVTDRALLTFFGRSVVLVQVARTLIVVAMGWL